jgi:phage gp36-like protein
MALPITITSVGAVITAQPLIQSASAITSAQIALHLAQSEALVWAWTSKRYATPITPTPPLLESICIDLAVYGVLVKQAIMANSLEESPWPDRYKEAMELLMDVGAGKVPLLDGSMQVITGSSQTSGRFSFSSPSYKPTFTELPPELAQVDPDKIDDLLAER